MPDFPIYAQKTDSLNQIILDLYSDTIKGNDKYINFLRELQGILYFDFGNILFFVKSENSYDLESFCQIGWDRKIEELYLSTYYKDDDVFPIFEKKSPVIMRSSDMFDDTRTISEYYKSFMQAAGFDRSLECNIILPNNINSYGICSLFRKIPKQDFNYEEKKIFGFLQPHLSNCARLDRIHGGELEDSTGNKSFLFGTLVLNQNGEIQHISEDFKNILFKYNRQSNLNETVKEIFEAAKIMERKDSNGPLYKLESIPIMVEIINSMSREKEERKYHCNIFDSMGIVSSCLKRAEKEFHLTSTEMKILECTIRGKHREEISKECFVSVPTIKKHIASIYRKMDITNHMQILERLGILAYIR